MAAKRSKHQLAEISRLIRALYEAGEYGTWDEFADAADLQAPQLSLWKNGAAEPSGYNLVKLIRATAARGSVEPSFAALGSVDPDRLAAVEAGILEAIGNQAKALAFFDFLKASMLDLGAAAKRNREAIEALKGEVEALRKRLEPPRRKRAS